MKPSRSVFYSEIIEDELKKRFYTISYKKLKAAQKGGPDPLRRSLQVLKIMHDLRDRNTRLETECSALLYIPITPDPLPKQRRIQHHQQPQSNKMVVVIEQAPPQRISSSSPSSNPTIVPDNDEEDMIIEDDDVEMVDDGNDGGSMQRKRKANGVNDAGRCDSKLRIYESQ